MIVVGARFRALAGARAALRAVRSSVDVAPGDVSVRARQHALQVPIDDFVLAGRFEPEDVDTVVQSSTAHGGRVLMQRIESRAAVAPTASVAPPRAGTRQVAAAGRPPTTVGTRKTRCARPPRHCGSGRRRSQRMEG